MLSFGGVDGYDLLDQCFDHHPESNPDKKQKNKKKNMIFSHFCSKC